MLINTKFCDVNNGNSTYMNIFFFFTTRQKIEIKWNMAFKSINVDDLFSFSDLSQDFFLFFFKSFCKKHKTKLKNAHD